MEPFHFILNTISDHFLCQLVKPEISFGNYFFRWDEKSLGIYNNEISDFKKFIKRMIPNLEFMMKMFNVSKNPKEKYVQLEKKIVERGQFSISDKHNNNVKFVLYVDINGSSIFYREEKVLIDSKIYKKMNMHSIQKNIETSIKTEDFKSIAVNWKLGDLLFNRNEIKSNRNQKLYSS